MIVRSALLIFLLAAAAWGEEKKELTIEEFLQSLSTVPELMTRKDPFVQGPPPFQAPPADSGGYNPNLPVLERYPIEDYTVLAVLLGERYPRALVKLPDHANSKVVIVKEKDRIGNKGGIINTISKEGLKVMQNQRSPLGFVDKTEVLLQIQTKAN